MVTSDAGMRRIQVRRRAENAPAAIYFRLIERGCKIQCYSPLEENSIRLVIWGFDFDIGRLICWNRAEDRARSPFPIKSGLH